MNVVIRKAIIEDAELIADLSRKTFYDTFAKDNTEEDMNIFMNEQFSKEKLMKQVEDNQDTFLLVFDKDDTLEESCLGYVRLTERSEDRNESLFKDKQYIELARIYVVQSAKRRGIGKILVQESIDIAKSLNKEIIWLGVWEKNPSAIAFYEKMGFKSFGSHDFLLGHDLQTDLLFYKFLS